MSASLTDLPPLVQTKQQLDQLRATLSQQSVVAIDTESNSLYSYPEQVCLIQFSIPDADFLLDPLALPDLQSLREVFARPEITKVLHGAEYDVACLKRDFDLHLTNLFDTRVAARSLGRKRTGLGGLLDETFDVKLNKRFQRANWGKRPLPEEMLRYARMDTHYLLPLREKLVEALKQKGKLQEVLEACELLAIQNAHANTFDPDGFWRIRHARDLKPNQQAILRALYIWRESAARKLSRPPFKIMGDKTFMAISLASPENIDALSAVPGVTPGQMKRFGNQLLQAISEGRRSGVPARPKRKRIDEKTISIYERLRSWRKEVAGRLQVDSDIVLPRDILWGIAHAAPKDAESLRKVMHPLESRFRTYGDEILELVCHT